MPAFGTVDLAKIREGSVRRWRKDRLSAGPKQARPFGPVTVTKPYRLMHDIMTTAVEDGATRHNPCHIIGAGLEYSDERPVVPVAVLVELLDQVPARALSRPRAPGHVRQSPFPRAGRAAPRSARPRHLRSPGDRVTGGAERRSGRGFALPAGVGTRLDGNGGERRELRVTAEASEMVTVPRAELDALRAEVRRLRREVGRSMARARMETDPGPGDGSLTMSRSELAEAWGIGE
jgi:hypothetical protein